METQVDYIKYLQGLLDKNNISYQSQNEVSVKNAQLQQQSSNQTPLQTNLQQLNDPLSYQQIERYKRQMILPEISLEGQIKLNQARVLIVGVGGIGCPAAIYLAGAGVGTIGLVDGDTVDNSNLHRQILHTPERVGQNKCDSAATYIHSFNPLVKVEIHPQNLNPEFSSELFQQYDVILDATDNPKARYLVNDTAIINKVQQQTFNFRISCWMGRINKYLWLQKWSMLQMPFSRMSKRSEKLQ